MDGFIKNNFYSLLDIVLCHNILIKFNRIKIMAKIKKTLSEKEKELHQIIADAKNKLSKLQNKQKIEIGELACKHGLHEFSIDVLENEFKNLYELLKK
jgi:hypothetical protein